MKMKILCKILLIVILIAVLTAGTAFVIKGTNGLESDFRFYYLDINGDKVFDSPSELRVSPGKEYIIQVKNTFGTLQDDAILGDVTVTANSNVSFDYYVGDERKSWNEDAPDFTTWFISLEEDYFVLRAPTTSLQSLLQILYGGAEITLPEEFNEDIYPFSLTVKSNKSNYIVNFRIPVYEPTIEAIEPSEVIF